MFAYLLLTIHYLFSVALANSRNDLIFDYFVYKKVPSVVGFSCHKIKVVDFALIKRLNDIGLTVSVHTIEDFYEIRKVAFTAYNRLGIFLDYQCYSKEEANFIFSNASDYRFYGELHYWLIVGSTLENVTNSINDEAFNLSTDFVIAETSVNNLFEKYDLYDTYNPWKKRGAKLNVTFIGSWSNMYKIEVISNKSKFDRRDNMKKLPLKAFFYWSKDRPISMPLEDYLQIHTRFPIEGMGKFGYNMLKHFSELYNFTLQVNMAPLWEQGDRVGPIQRAVFKDECDITGSLTTFTKIRYQYVQYIYQSFPFRSCFMFRTPQKKEIKMNEIFGPFNTDVWNAMAIFILSCTALMSFLFQNEIYDTRILKYSNSFLITLGSLCQQGTNLSMTQQSTRAAFFCIMISSLLIYNYYGAVVVSVRLNEPILKINDSLVELSKLNFKYASQWLVYFELLMKAPDYETQVFYNKSWKKVPEADQFMDPEKGMQLVRKGGFAYHTLPDVGYPILSRYYSNREICELTEVHLYKVKNAFAISHYSTFTELSRVGFTKIAEVGIQHRQIKRWTIEKPVCYQNIVNLSGLTMYEFAPHLLILVIGMGLSALVLILELAKHSFRELDTGH